jgi:hypothetical protein
MLHLGSPFIVVVVVIHSDWYLPVLPVSEVWNMGYSAPWTLLNKFFSSPGW